MKIGDQLRFFAALKNLSGKEAEQRIDDWLVRVKLSEWKNKRSVELSKGDAAEVQFVSRGIA